MPRYALLILLGFLWSARLAAIKAAGLAGAPVHATISLSVFGIAALFTALALWRRSWPPVNRSTMRFYVLSGALGFILPFALENIVAPNLPVFALVVIIATMPIATLSLAWALGTERVGPTELGVIGVGFCVALLIAWDTTRLDASDGLSWTWAAIAFGVPVLYALNTVFVASQWPKAADAIHVAQAQALIVSVAALVGGLAFGSAAEWPAALASAPAIGMIVLTEAAALLVYLRITRDYGATFVALANYIAMAFAAGLGAALFGDRVTWVSGAAALLLIVALTVRQRYGRKPSAET